MFILDSSLIPGLFAGYDAEGASARRGLHREVRMKKGKIPLYQEIYTSLLNDIRTGRYQAGQQLPTEQELAELFQVSKITSRRALDLLVDEGCITRISGKGSFVIAPDSEVGTRLDAGGGKPAKGMLFEIGRAHV